MELKEFQEKMVECGMMYAEHNQIKIDEDYALLKFYEEVGELAQAVLVHKKKCRQDKIMTAEQSKKNIGKEVADVIGSLFVICHILKIDIEKAADEKWFHWLRKEKKPGRLL